MAVIDPPGAVNFSKQTDDPKPYSSAPECEPYLSDSSVSASEPTVESHDKHADSESESDINGTDKQLTEKDVFGSSSDDEEANTTKGCPEKAASDGDSAVECHSEDDENAESDAQDVNGATASSDKDAEWARYIADIKQLHIDELNGEPPTDELCFGYAESAMTRPISWYQVLHDGIFEHALLRPVVDRVLRYLVIERGKGNKAAATAIVAAALCGYTAAPAAGGIQAEPMQDAEPNLEADMSINVKELVMDEFMARMQKRMINDIRDVPLEDTVIKRMADCAMVDLE